MSRINTYKDLLVWQKGMQIVKLTYALCAHFPQSEQFGLTSQIKRSAISIPSNIAEGYGRDYTRNYSYFLKVARGSLLELETQMLIAINLEFVEEKLSSELLSAITEESKMLNALIKKMIEATAN